MERNAIIISIDEFKQKILDYNINSSITKIGDLDTSNMKFYNYECELMTSFLENPVIDKDVQKIHFDYENVGCEEFVVLKNGLPVIKCWAGGDWELPVYFIIYWSGTEFRGYTPENGNIFNPITKTAYGSEDDCNLFYNNRKYNRDFIKQMFPDLKDEIDQLNDNDLRDKVEDLLCELMEKHEDQNPDWDIMEEEIINKIKIN